MNQAEDHNRPDESAASATPRPKAPPINASPVGSTSNQPPATQPLAAAWPDGVSPQGITHIPDDLPTLAPGGHRGAVFTRFSGTGVAPLPLVERQERRARTMTIGLVALAIVVLGIVVILNFSTQAHSSAKGKEGQASLPSTQVTMAATITPNAGQPTTTPAQGGGQPTTMPRATATATTQPASTSIPRPTATSLPVPTSTPTPQNCGFWVTEAQNTDASNQYVHITTTLQRESNCNVWQVATTVWNSPSSPYGTITVENKASAASDSQGDNLVTYQGGPWHIPVNDAPTVYGPEPGGACGSGWSVALQSGGQVITQTTAPSTVLYICP